ncbi:voltage-gated potassium channel [Halarchaeum rubridurum]|uniref:Potassium channel protein n=1 Tax=Halarchaeum rubridurum TaxID=489911 RepID=A0A830FX14_9EURY|nr:NAD-binding protein [Halarchaeum rubridurum]MBP1953982.1 voltage-gated potassium channel [Halarchaeum rubridurum]GGM56422.1 potassium channel protein [Halarchaeum rubridurum]
MARTNRRLLSSRAAVLLTSLVAVLSVVTGVVNILSPQFGPYVPGPVQQVAGFTGTLTGFLMVVSALGMRRGLRAAWWSTVVLLPVTAAQGLVQVSVYSVPLVVLSLLSLPTVVLTRSRFDRELSLSTSQITAALALAGVLAYGTVGTYALRDGFPGVSSLLDAFYYTLVTASTVGYGDITPKTEMATLFSLSVLVLGVAGFGIALSTLLGPAIEARFASALGRMTQSQLESLEHHVIVAGYGELTESILEELGDDHEFVVVVKEPTTASALRERGFNVLTEDPSDAASLDHAGIDRADAVVAATNDDGQDALAILTARQLQPDVRIVAAATERENEEKLRAAGADTVISPAVIGGRLLVQSALGDEHAEETAKQVTEGEEPGGSPETQSDEAADGN